MALSMPLPPEVMLGTILSSPASQTIGVGRCRAATRRRAAASLLDVDAGVDADLAVSVRVAFIPSTASCASANDTPQLLEVDAGHACVVLEDAESTVDLSRAAARFP